MSSSPVLKLERMEISGFKSFSDRTEVTFGDGIVAVVGPNGCGKSNIGDAINWVLGEQSPRALRGTQMADVIFKGSQTRKPVSLAEVSLHLSSSNGVLPGGERRMVLTRRLFRDGESEYLINGSRKRLRDIQEVLRAAHVGAKSYATIEQGRIEQIMNAKPKDRRLIIEDAAGVSGFKHKRRLAELKLEGTQANLLRVEDVLGEVRRQINSLKRQASRARRYRRLRDELRGKERLRFALRARGLDAALDRARRAEAEARQAEAEAAARAASLDAELEAERIALDEAQRSVREGSEELHRLELELDRGETEIRRCRERFDEAEAAAGRLEAEAEALAERREALREDLAARESERVREEKRIEALRRRLEGKQAALEDASARREALRDRVEELRNGLFGSMNRAAEGRNRRRALEEAIERNRSQRRRASDESTSAKDDLARLEREAASLEERAEEQRRGVERLERDLAAAERSLQEARRGEEAAADALSSARQREKSAAARLHTLEDVETRFAGVSDGVRALLSSGAAAGVRVAGVVADYVHAGREVEAAAEAFLATLLPAVLVEDDGDVRRAADLLRAGKTGRAPILSRSRSAARPAACAESAPPPELLAERGVRGLLRDHLRLALPADGAVGRRIGGAVLVEDLATALSLHSRHPGTDYVTLEGDVVHASGLVVAGSGDSEGNGLLAHARRIQEARRELHDATAAAAALEARLGTTRSRREVLEREVRDGRSGLEEARTRRVELGLALERALEEAERTRRRTGVAEEERALLDQEAARLEQELAAVVAEVKESETAHRGAESSLEKEISRLQAIEEELRVLREGEAGLREELAAAGQRTGAAVREAERIRNEVREIETRREQSLAEAVAARQRARENDEARRANEEAMAHMVKRRQESAAEMERRERAIGELRETVAAREEAARSLRIALEQAREAVREAELARAGAEADRRHLEELCLQELGVAIGAAATDDGGEGVPAEVDVDALEVEVRELKEKIERIGPVNLMAIEEFSELEERHRHLAEQKEDLEQSVRSLRDSIRRINRTSRQRFSEAFEKIRLSYQEIFRVLFNGGRADLRLEEDEDVLECGIEILAQPPGKRLGSIQLLSGGEKAMAAIALLFAIFRYRPSPFCLLDEVDAPLDESNVGRFARMLREYARQTQFILITHNKLSMEAADRLYGITMEEPGVSKVISLELH